MIKARILVVEDDRSLAEVLRYNLSTEGYEVLVANDGLEGLRQAQRSIPDIILLDLMLPGMNGLEVCRRLREDPSTCDIRIVMLTAKDEEHDQLLGFSIGADDYVTKPFSLKVLLERIKAIQRRSQPERDLENVVSHQGVRIDRRGHRAWAGDIPITLTLSEFRILETLLSQPGRVFSRQELVERALGTEHLPVARTIDVHIRALRVKLLTYAHLIETVRGTGYRFRAAPETPGEEA